MTDSKPQVLYLSDKRATADLVKARLSRNFQVTAVLGVAHVDAALDAICQLKPAYVLLDPALPHLDPQQLYLRLKADQELQGVMILAVGEEEDDVP